MPGYVLTGRVIWCLKSFIRSYASESQELLYLQADILNSFFF
jgi:hypothetical protein